MKTLRWLAFSLTFLLISCQSSSATITIMDGDQIETLESSESIPAVILTQAGIALLPDDRVLSNGILLPLDQALPEKDAIQLQIRRAVTLTINTPEGQQAVQSAALTVGQALSDAGFQLYKSDLIDPPANTPISASMTINYTPSRDLTIYVDNGAVNIRSAANIVGDILAGAGLPLIGLDFSSPPEDEAPPPDGQIRVIRVTEKVEIKLEQIPFTTQITESKDVPLGQQETIQPGLNGLAMTRTRIRFEDGVEVSRAVENKSVIREPVMRIVASGGQVTLAPVPASGVPSDYWLALQMYATVYSPCQSGVSGCSYSTASGARAGKGIVAVDYSIYSELAGMRVYIPGYGLATIGDTGGGPIIESALGVPRTRWIDLGFNEGEIVDMTGWVTVYFLAPAPANIPYFLK